MQKIIYFLVLMLAWGMASAQNWEPLGPNEFNRPSLGPALYTSMAIGGNGITYAAFQDGANDYKATVMKFNNGMWVPVGNVGFSSGLAYYTSIAVDANGTPYVVYQDYSNFAKATVMKFNGNNWEIVGVPGFSSQGVIYTSIAIDGNGTPYVVYHDYGNNDKATVMKFNGTSWELVGDPGFSAGRADYTSIKFDNTGTPYVLYQDYGNDQKATLMKYNGNNWENVGNPGFSIGLVYYPSLTFDSNNIPYVAYQDAGNGYKATVMKFDDSSWTAVGSPGFSSFSAEFTSIAIDNVGKLYVAFRSNAHNATVMEFDDTSWIVTGNPNFSVGDAFYTSIVIDGSGTPTVIYQDHGYEQMAIVKKLNGSIWETVGAEGFSAGAAFYSAIAVNESGIPYVLYSDGGNGSKATVKKYNGTYWETVGIEGFSAKGTMLNSIAIDGNGTPYVAFSEFLGGDLLKPSIMKFNGISWEYVGSPQLTQYGGMYTDIAIDASGTPYVVYTDRAIDNSWKATVIKFDGSNWITVGNSAISSGYAAYTSIAIDYSGTPYVVYQDIGITYLYKATVMKLNTSSNIWEPVGNPGFSAGDVHFTDIAIDHSGTPYVVYEDFANSEKVTVMKFNGTSWEPVGTPGFSQDESDRFTSIAIDNSGTPYVAFEDISSGGGKSNATVMKYNGNSWEVVGNSRFSRGQAYYISMALDGNGNPIVAFDNRGAWAYKFTSDCVDCTPPAITSISPTSGPVGTLVTITGTDLNNPTAFTIGGTPAIVISNDGTTLVGMVMPGATTGNVSVTTANGTATSGGSFTVTPTLYPNTQQGGKLVGTGGTAASRQGYSVAVSADGNTAIVGGYSDNSFNGAVWVYTRSNGIWAQQGNKLVGTGGSANALQGTSISLSADGNTAIVGGPNDNGGVGAVWVFTRTNGLWSQQGNKLVGTGAVGQSKQGTSVSISADGNTAIVGGMSDNNFAGAAWIYTRTNGLWIQQGNKLVGTGAISETQQGTSVAISADSHTAVVGGYTDNNNIGAAWIYTRTNGVWTQQGTKLVGTGATGNALQGTSVSLSADGNTVIVGGHSDNNFIGAAWVFTRSGGVWSQQGNKLVGTIAIAAQEQGHSVSLSADGNTAIVGGSYDNGLFGAAWVFTRSGGVWTQQGSKLVGTGAVFSPEQGTSVSISADGNTAIVGGPGDASQTGAAWVFHYSNIPTIQASSISFTNIQTNQMILNWTNGNGTSRAVFVKQGDSGTATPVNNTTYTANAAFGSGTEIDASGWYCVYNGSGSTVSVTGLSANTSYIAQVFEYNGSAGGELYGTATGTNNPNTQATLPVAPTITSISPESGAVGTLVTITGTDLSNPTAFTIGGTPAIVISNDGTTLVGMVMPGAATGNVSVTTANGTATSGSSFTVTPTLYPNAQQGEKLVGTDAVGQSFQGASVSVSADGNTAIVGGYFDNNGIGAAWVYTRSNGIWTQQGSKLIGTGADGQSRQGFSVSVSADGNTAIVGGFGDNGNVGAVWIYIRNGEVWTQQGSKLAGTGTVGAALLGWSVSISADGNTAIIGGYNDNNGTGASWLYTRNNGVWTQQGNKLVGTGAVFNSGQGYSVSISADGNTALIGGSYDNAGTGATWVFTRNGGVWTQQGSKLVGTGAVGNAQQGQSVTISADGNTAIVGGPNDDSGAGAAWVYTRSEGVWTQQGNKLVGTGAVGNAQQGYSVSVSANGNTAIVTGIKDNNEEGAVWVFTRNNGIWTQQGSKLVGTGGVFNPQQGMSVSLSSDGNTAIVGGWPDNSGIGAAWVFTASDCINPATAGTIGNAQNHCGSFTPSTLTSTELPSGHSGTLEYKWQVSTLNSSSGFTDIASSNTATYTPGVVAQTSWYKRLAKVTCETDWTGAAESNVIEITVYPVPDAPTASVTEQPTCSLATGTITVSAPTPSEGIFYSIDGSDYTNTTGVFTAVAPGDYEVTVKDGNECISEATNVTVDPQPEAPTLAVGSVIDPETCGGTGSIVLNFTNVPDGSYTINYSAGSFTNVAVASNTATIPAMAGTYTDLQITVRGCTSAAGVNATLSDPGLSYGTLEMGDQSFCNSGDPALISFASMPEGSATFGYQWYYANGLIDSPTGTNATGWTLISGATSSSYDPPSGLTLSRTYAVMVTPDCGNSVATWAAGARQITVETAPVVTIGVSSPDNFNSDLTLTANPSPAGDYTYLWSPGGETTPGITLNSTNGDGLYTVVVTTASECASTPVAYNYQKQNLVNSYTILGLSQVSLSANNFVQTGSVGNTAKNGRVTIGLNSSVNGPGSFVKAKNISVATPSLVTNQIFQPVTAVLPAIRTNTTNPKAFANLNVANNQTNTYAGNYRDVTVGANCNVTFSGTIFGKMTIGQGSQVTFTAATVNVQSITMANGTAALPGKLLFAGDAAVLVSNGVTIGNNSQVNTAGDYSVVFYMNGFDYHILPGGNVTVKASVYSPKGSITVEGHTTNATHMVGTYIASNITSKNSNIYWNSEAAAPLVAPALAKVKSAKIEPVAPQPQVKFYPNPFTERLNFEFSNVTDVHARLEIFNLAGSRLETLYDGNIKGGQVYQIEYLPRLVGSQTLIYHLTIGGKVYVDKLIYQERR